MATARTFLVVSAALLLATVAFAADEPKLQAVGELDVINAGRQLKQSSPVPTPEPTKKAEWWCFCGRRRLIEMASRVGTTVGNVLNSLESPTAPLARIETTSTSRKLLQTPTPEPTKKADWYCFCGSGRRRLIQLASAAARIFVPSNPVPVVMPASS